MYWQLRQPCARLESSSRAGRPFISRDLSLVWGIFQVIGLYSFAGPLNEALKENATYLLSILEDFLLIPGVVGLHFLVSVRRSVLQLTLDMGYPLAYSVRCPHRYRVVDIDSALEMT